MTATVFKLNTLNTTNLVKIKDLPANLKGYALINTSGAAIFVKFYWYTPTASNPTPTVGSTVPDITIQIPTVAGLTESWPDGISKAGLLFMAVTLLGTDADATAVAAGAGILSVLYE